MLYECLVIDNSNFFKNGTIRVRMKRDVSSRTMLKDLSLNPKESINKNGGQRYERFGGNREFKYDDRDIRVSTNIGGAYDYGVFILPQPNTWGIASEVSDYDDSPSEPRFIWLGAISMFNMKTKDIDIPSDSLEDPNGCNEGKINLEKPYDGLVFKQKETHISDSAEEITDDSFKTLNWKSRPTQNMIVINENKIFIVHNNYDEDHNVTGQSELLLDENGTKIDYFNNGEENSNAHLSLNKDGTFNLLSTNSKNNITNELSTTETNLMLSHSDPKSNSSLFMGNDMSEKPTLNLNLKDLTSEGASTEIIMNAKSGITINSNGDISINPGKNKNVTLGTGEGYILTSNRPGTFNLDNHTIIATRNAKA